MRGVLKKIFLGVALAASLGGRLQAAPDKNCDDAPMSLAANDDGGPVFFGVRTVSLAEGKGVESSDPVEWIAVRLRHERMLRDYEHAQFAWTEWMRPFEYLRMKTFVEMASGADAGVDKAIAYRSDMFVYGISDYWSSPGETVKKRMGDCEDIATLKYFTLRSLGVPADRLYILIVNYDEKDNHVVLAMDIRGPGETRPHFVLLEDEGNRAGAGKLFELQDDPYELIYAMNENGIWKAPDADTAEKPSLSRRPAPRSSRP